jgi:hypothetical protein
VEEDEGAATAAATKLSRRTLGYGIQFSVNVVACALRFGFYLDFNFYLLMPTFKFVTTCILSIFLVVYASECNKPTLIILTFAW